MARELTVEAKPQEGFGGGFRQGWISGEGDGVEFSLDSGAGLGNPYLTLHVEFEDGTTVWENIDMRTLVTAWVNSIKDERDV